MDPMKWGNLKCAVTVESTTPKLEGARCVCRLVQCVTLRHGLTFESTIHDFQKLTVNGGGGCCWGEGEGSLLKWGYLKYDVTLESTTPNLEVLAVRAAF